MMARASSATVGIIGVGSLGLAIAERLIAAGLAVHGYRRGSLEEFVGVGGRAAASVSEIAATADHILILLPNDDALLRVMADICGSLGKRHVLTCLSTHPIHVKEEAALIADTVGVAFLDGEISGTPAMLRAGRASVMVAGDAAAVGRARSVLEIIGPVSHLEHFGDAAKMKLITNYLVALHTIAAAEALQYAVSLGLDASEAVEVIGPSAGGSTMLSVRGLMMAKGTYAAGDTGEFLRYFEYLRSALETQGAGAGPLLHLVEAVYRQSIVDGYNDKDLAAIFEWFGSQSIDATVTFSSSVERGRRD